MTLVGGFFRRRPLAFPAGGRFFLAPSPDLPARRAFSLPPPGFPAGGVFFLSPPPGLKSGGGGVYSLG